jgi:hypothetical protein
LPIPLAFLVASAIADYSMDRVEREIPLHLSKREVYFGDYQNFLVLAMELVIC